eukprot:1347985-Amorphochlora_amoeboformis.AAC.1
MLRRPHALGNGRSDEHRRTPSLDSARTRISILPQLFLNDDSCGISITADVALACTPFAFCGMKATVLWSDTMWAWAWESADRIELEQALGVPESTHSSAAMSNLRIRQIRASRPGQGRA